MTIGTINSSGNIDAKKTLERVKISKIHFLVHPGYLLNTQTLLVTEKSDDFDEKYFQLLSSYRKKAQNLPKNEIMIVVSHMPQSSFRSGKESGEGFMAILEDIKNILGRRCIVISQDTVPCDFRGEFKITDEGMESLEKIILQRGFDFNRNVLTEAYGETFSFCVHSVANSINKKAGFGPRTEINTSLTDLGIADSSISRENLEPDYVNILNKRFNHTNTEPED